MATQYYNEMNTIDLVNSPQWVDIFNFSQEFNHEPTEEELLEYGVYVEGNNLMKDFVLSIDRNPCTVKFRMTVEPIIGTDNYKLFVRGCAIDSTFNDFIKDVSLAIVSAISD